MKQVPTLNLNGYVTEPEKGLSEILAMYFANKRSQSDVFKVASIAHDIAESSEDAVYLATLIRMSLEKMYRAYYQDVVDIDVTPTYRKTDRGQWHIGVSVTVFDNGNSYSLATTYEEYEGGFKQLLEDQ